LAAAYNHGFRVDIESLKAATRKSFFYIGLISPETKYNYSDISAEFSIKHCGM